MHISNMSGKLEELKAINTNGLSNSFCRKMGKCGKDNVICKFCYSVDMLQGYRKCCVPPFQRNSEILSKPLKSVPRFKFSVDIVRLHAHGELINRQHYLNFIEIAKHNPDKMFTLWTKRIPLIKGIERPKNMILIYSNPFINKKVKLPAGFDKVFSVFTPEYARKHRIKINCGGKACNPCRLCYRKNRTIYVNELLKKA